MSSPATSPLQNRVKEWSLFYYMDGSSNFRNVREALTSNLLDLQQVGSSEEVNAVALLSRKNLKVVPRNLPMLLYEGLQTLLGNRKSVLSVPWKGVKIFQIKKDQPDKKEITSSLVHGFPQEGKSNPRSTSPETLAQFLIQSIKKFPAKRYALIMSNHGNGWVGIGLDEWGKQMSMAGLKEALMKVKNETGVAFDLLGMEACQMGQVEVAYQMKEVAHYFVASPTDLLGKGWPQKKILTALCSRKGAMTPEELATTIIEESRRSSEDVPVVTALDLSKMKSFPQVVNSFSQALMETTASEGTMERIVYRTRYYDEPERVGARPAMEYADLYDFASRIVEDRAIHDHRLRESAREVRSALTDMVVAHQQDGLATKDPCYMAIYLPTGKGLFHPFNPAYRKLDFARETLWDEFLARKKF